MGEEGLVATAGAEFMALETTEEAGTCLAFRSMLGLVGSSVRGWAALQEGSGQDGTGEDPAGTLPPAFLAAGGGLQVPGLGWGTRSHLQKSQGPVLPLPT